MRLIEIIDDELTQQVDMAESMTGFRNAVAASAVAATLAAGSYGLYKDRTPAPHAPTPVVQTAEQPVQRSKYAPNYPIELTQMEGEELKSEFVKMMVPMIGAVQDEILHDRRTILRLASKPRLTVSEKEWLQTKMAEYKVPDPRDIGELVKRVDVVPVSMALAQAVEESGWGTSRVAQKTNGFFGQKGTSTCAVSASDGGSHPCFNNPRASIRSYMRNLNTHPAYNKFRQTRWDMRKNEQPLDSSELLTGIMSYSTLGHKYVSKIKGHIKQYDFKKFDRKSKQTQVASLN